ncbi:MAG: hypothetical protein FWH53_03330 [Leptospirales bacterium]|nr:hypothetical protein [Leptospirales bacterium]
MKIRYFIYVLTLLFVLLKVNTLYAEIDTVTLTSVNFGATIDGANYFKSGGTYTFNIRVTTSTSAWVDNWDTVSIIKLTIPTSGSDIVIEITESILGAGIRSGRNIDTSGMGSVTNIVFDDSLSDTDFTVSFVYTPSNSIPETPVMPYALIVAYVSGTDGALNTQDSGSSIYYSYGITSEGITKVIVTPPSPGPPGVSGTLIGTPTPSYYYLEGETYDFEVEVEANGHSWNCIKNVTLTIQTNTGGDIKLTATGINGTNTVAVTLNNVSNTTLLTASCTVTSGDHNNFTLQFTIKLAANQTSIDSPYASRTIFASAESMLFDETKSATVNTQYGIATAGIKSVTVASVAPGKQVDSEDYYVAGETYNFQVTVTANGHSLDCIDNVTLTIPIPSGGDIILKATFASGTIQVSDIGGSAAIYQSGGPSCSITNGSPPYNNFTLQFSFTLDATTTGSAIDSSPDNRTITASAESILFPGSELNSIGVSKKYGIATAGIKSISVAPPSSGPGVSGTQIGTSPYSYYYLAGTEYVFEVTGTANGHRWGCIDNITLTIPTDGTPIVFKLELALGAINLPSSVSGTHGESASIELESGKTHNDFIIKFKYTPRPNITAIDSAYPITPRSITVSATSRLFSEDVVPGPAVTISYGIATAGIKNISVAAPVSGSTPLNSLTPSDNSVYYLAGTQYEFTVTGTANGHIWGCIDNITLTIPTNGTPIVFKLELAPGATTSLPSSANDINHTGVSALIELESGKTHNDFIIKFKYTPTPGHNIDSIYATRSIEVSATSRLFSGPSPPATVTSNVSTSYAIATTGIQQINLAVPTGTKIDDKEYYVAPNTGTPQPRYRFTVTGSANGHRWECLNDITLTIPTGRPTGGTPIVFSFRPNGTNGLLPGTNPGGSAYIRYTPVTWNQTPLTAFTIDIVYTPRPDTPDIDSTCVSRQITLTANSALIAGTIAPVTLPPKEYGIVSRGIAITNISTNINAINTGLGTTSNYFFPGVEYTFFVDVTSVGHSWNCISNITLPIPMPTAASPGRIITVALNLTGTGGSSPASGNVLSYTDSTTPTVTGVANNVNVVSGSTPGSFRVAFTFKPPWSEEIAHVTPAPRNILPSTTFLTMDSLPAVASLSVSPDYGVCSSARVILNLLNEAADSYVNPWNGNFTIDGTIVYNILGQDIPVATSGLITPQPQLIYSFINDHSSFTNSISAYTNDSNLLSVTGSAPYSTLNFPVPADWFSTNAGAKSHARNGIGEYRWGVSATIGGKLQKCVPTDPVLLTCDRIKIIDMEFSGGGGVDRRPNYYRNIYTPGTKVRVKAQYEYLPAISPPRDNIDLELICNYGSGDTPPIFLNIASMDGSPDLAGWSTWVEIFNPTDAYVPGGDIKIFTQSVPSPLVFYRVNRVNKTSGTVGIFGGVGVGQFDDKVYTNPRVSHRDVTDLFIYWGNGKSPGKDGGPFTTWKSTEQGSDSIILTWYALDDDDELQYPPPLDAPTEIDKNGAFYTYRIYYRVTGTDVWSVIDKDIASELGSISTPTYTITNLQAMFSYDYYLTALDLFDNETPMGNRSFLGAPTPGPADPPWGTVTTNPAQTIVKISDNTIENTYSELEFKLEARPILTDTEITDLDPLNRKLFESAIKVDVSMLGAVQPEELNIILREFNTADLFVNISTKQLIGRGTEDLAEGFDYYRIKLSKIGANKWQAFISADNPLIKTGKKCMFILESIKDGTPVYFDYDSKDETTPPFDPNNYPWTFAIVNSPNFKPWPTRVLNNVITDKNPVAYPSYYLTDDAFVTITAYDIKGRVVAVLLDNAPRKSGQNIKENGWRGINRSGKKLGVGLYYVRIKAVRQSDGKTIIDKYSKVVMAR